MRRSVIPFVALAFCGGLLLHCELGAPVWAGPTDDEETEACECPAPPEPITIEGSCDKLQTLQSNPNHYQYYSEIVDERIKPESVVSVMLCDRTCFKQDTQAIIECTGCPPGFNCIGESVSDGWAPFDEIQCIRAGAFAVEDGRLVVQCSGGTFTYRYERILVNVR